MSWTSVLLLLLSPITCGFTLAQTPDDFKDVIMGCSNMGVFHVERGRYQLTYEQADGLCKAYGVVLANEEQLKVAHQNNFQTCRNGWVYNKTVMIPRIDSNELCGGGKTGLIFVTDNQTKYDAYCFNATETKPINCATRTIVPTSPKPSTVAAVTEGTTAKTADTTTYAVKDNEGEEEVSTTSIPLVTSTEIWTNEDEVTSTPSMLSTLHEKNTGSRSSNKSRPYYIGEEPSASTADPSSFSVHNVTTFPATLPLTTPSGDSTEDMSHRGDSGVEVTTQTFQEVNDSSSQPPTNEDGIVAGSKGDELVTEGPEDLVTPTAQNTPTSFPIETFWMSTSVDIDADNITQSNEGLEALPPDPINSNSSSSSVERDDKAANTDFIDSSYFNTSLSPVRFISHYLQDWLIILAIALSVLILAFVCIAILYRRKYHGKKQKLVISGKPAQGSKEDTAQNEKEQEMVRLMNQEKAMENGGTNEDFTDITLDEQAEKV
ncbi:CD44 antigen-like isoform X1 [Polypterus senegalus]|uniref:CD44 antigen-like isoform X1 n=1 Tax=Polypterus senegalus TaxID=55291 RepID=UPI00196614F8|nr:CD44 antigen-like isoform X1 [Polypterus senegalus]